MSCEFRIFRHFVTIFRNLVIFRMSYLLNQMRFSKTFFTFKFFSEYSFKIANLLWHKLKLIFCCQSYDVIFAPKTVKINNPKTLDCWENKVLLSCKVAAQTVKNWKTSLKEITFRWQLTQREGWNLECQWLSIAKNLIEFSQWIEGEFSLNWNLLLNRNRYGIELDCHWIEIE